MSAQEKNAINKIMLERSPQSILFRNNTGLGWVGKTRKVDNCIVIENPRPLHAGLCEGSSDIIGWTKRLITREDVGKTLAIFTAIEVKTSKRIPVAKEQKNFIKNVLTDGGIGEIVVLEL